MLVALLAGLLAPSAAHAVTPCVVDEVETTIRWGRGPSGAGSRVDRVVLFAPDAQPDCQLLDLDDLPHTRLDAVRAVVRRPDERAVRLGDDRLENRVGGWRLHAPEVRRGATVELTLERTLLQPVTAWQPGRWGRDVRWARLRARGSSAMDAAAVAPLSYVPAGGPTKLRRRGRHAWVDEGATQQVALLVAPSPAELPGGPWGRAVHPSPTEAVPTATAVTLTIDAAAPRLPDEPPAGTTTVAHQAPSGDAVVFPRGARDRACARGEAAGTPAAWGCWLPPGEGPITWSWVEPTLRVVGEAAPSACLSVTAEGGEVALDPTDDPRQWRLTAAGGAPVLPDRAAVLSQVAYAAIQASLPEPGLPLRFKNRPVTDETPAEVLDLVRSRARPAALPGRGPLSPRRLVEIKPSGWATPWEQALLLTRYLRQLKLDAVPVPVRPRTAGPGSPATPTGPLDAVVRLRRGDENLWLAPSCPLCAPGELPAALWGGLAYAEGIERLPGPPTGAVALERAGGSLVVRLDPPAALALRSSLLSLAPEERPAHLGRLYGGAGLQSQEGLSTPGAPVTLTLRAPEGPLPPLPALLGRPGPLPLTATLTTASPPATSGVLGVGVTRPGLDWTLEVRGPAGAATRTESLRLQPDALAPGAWEGLVGWAPEALRDVIAPRPPRQGPSPAGKMPETEEP